MNESAILDVTRQGLLVAAMVSLPVLAVALFIGIIVSVFQALTQVQEMTLTYVPKLLGAAFVTVLLGGWMMSTLVSFMRFCFDHAAGVTR